MRSLLLLLVFALGFIAQLTWCHAAPESATVRALSTSDSKLAWAFKNKISEIRVTCTGKVIYKLSDDTSGSRHQRFIIKLESGQTLLIAHNIDLAKRVARLRIGNKVTIRGEYIWNNKGGLMHYTHRDPAGIQPSGWIKHRGILYR
jgi:hypothetical protein